MNHITEVLSQSQNVIEHLIATKSLWDNSDKFYLSFLYNIHSNSLVFINDELISPFIKTDNYSNSIDLIDLYEQIDVTQNTCSEALEVNWCIVYNEMSEQPVGILDKSVAYLICEEPISIEQFAELATWGNYAAGKDRTLYEANKDHWFFSRRYSAVKPRYTIYQSKECYNNLLETIKTFQELKSVSKRLLLNPKKY